MNSDKLGLTWEQQVEYVRVHKYGRDLNMMFRQAQVQKEQVNNVFDAQELVDDR